MDDEKVLTSQAATAERGMIVATGARDNARQKGSVHGRLTSFGARAQMDATWLCASAFSLDDAGEVSIAL